MCVYVSDTSKLFQENPKNELGLSWIFLNIQARLSLDFQEILTTFFLQEYNHFSLKKKKRKEKKQISGLKPGSHPSH